MKSSDGKVAMVTGGSGLIGGAICKILAREGYLVYLLYNGNYENALEISKEIESNNNRVILKQCDLNEGEDIRNIFKEIKDSKYDLHILINNAASMVERPIGLLEERDIELMNSVNINGAFRCLNLAARLMMRNNDGVIINVSSLSHYLPLMGQLGYSTTKAGLLGMTKAAALELARFNIRVNAIVPGPVKGEMNYKQNQFKYFDKNKIPLKGIPEAEDIGYAVSFLCSDKAKWITGQSIQIDAGLSLTTLLTNIK